MRGCQRIECQEAELRVDFFGPLSFDESSTRSGTSDSGNASDSSDALPTKAVAAQDTVTVNSEHWNLLMNAFNIIIFPCSRTIHLPPSETQGNQLKTLSMMCTIYYIYRVNLVILTM